MNFRQFLESWVLPFKNAFSGLNHIYRTERNFRIHLFISLIVLTLLGIFKAPIHEWALIILVIGLVISAEILNTAIEIMVDIYCPYYHPLAKISKDVGAAAVLFTAIISVLVGFFVFIPHLLKLIN
jgi:diacylglycerol kinase